jgi:hypothetical protein
MATNLTVNFIGKNHLSKTTAVASRDLKKLGTTAKSVGNSINKSLGAVGLTLGVTALANGLKNATKAASDDRKSQGLLANALQNTVGATAGAIAGAEKYIKSTQLQTAVLDDELRPALATAVRATGSLSKGQELLDTALDVSAGTGKDLNTVTNAMAKAFNGSTGSLKKLLPSIKDGTDFMEQLQAQFNGSAEAAANLDPYKRLEVIFADIQETVGEALLPSLEQFAEYLASTEGQQNVKKIVDQFVLMGQVIGGIISLLVQNVNLVIGFGVQVLIVKSYFIALSVATKLVEVGIMKATTAIKLMKYALISSGIGAAIALVGTLAATWLEATEAKEGYDSSSNALDENGNYSAPIGPGLGPQGETWLTQGYDSFEAYLADIKAKKDKLVREAEDLADQIKKALASKIEGMKKTGERFRDSVAVAFGLFGEDEYAVFNVDYFKGKLQRMVEAAKGFASNLKQILKTPGSQSLVDELIAMGPVEGNIAAKALLASGDLKEIVGLKASLYKTGTQAGAVQAVAGTATYEININKAVISASDIIREIKLLEKKSGRKYLVN